jgi:Antitoxin of toxin-antitoxin, RelE / RelB, TA system
MLNEVTITTFREQSGPVFTEVVQHHRPQVIRRGRDDRGVLMGFDEVWAMVADREFNPQVMRGDEGVSIWLPEFEVYGEGDTYSEAKSDLLDEVRVYVQEYLEHADEYRRAPNRAGHLPHVVKALIAEARGELEQVIFPAPPALDAVRARLAAPATA